MNLYRFKGLETALIVANDETEAMGYLVEFLDDEIKDDGGSFATIAPDVEVSFVGDSVLGAQIMQTKKASEWMAEGPGVLAASVW
jgi:hypothetical protein